MKLMQDEHKTGALKSRFWNSSSVYDVIILQVLPQGRICVLWRWGLSHGAGNSEAKIIVRIAWLIPRAIVIASEFDFAQIL